jgi:sodium-coupled neutral amino acid transporter 11
MGEPWSNANRSGGPAPRHGRGSDGVLWAGAGASAVCIVCYVIPVAMHLLLYARDPGYKTLADAGRTPSALVQPLLSSSQASPSAPLAAPPAPARKDAAGPDRDCPPALDEGAGAAVAAREPCAGRGRAARCVEFLGEVALPLAVVGLGIGFSMAALFVAVVAMVS